MTGCAQEEGEGHIVHHNLVLVSVASKEELDLMLSHPELKALVSMRLDDKRALVDAGSANLLRSRLSDLGYQPVTAIAHQSRPALPAAHLRETQGASPERSAGQSAADGQQAR